MIDREMTENRMDSPAAARHGNSAMANSDEPFNQIEWEKRRVGGSGHDGFRHRSLEPRPYQAGENASQRADEAFDRVGDNRQAEIGEALGVAIGVEDEPVHLWLKAIDDVSEK